MKRSIWTYLLALVALQFLGACSKTRSTDVASTSVVYRMYATVEDDGTLTCVGILQAGGITGTYLELAGSDELYCTLGATSYTLAKDSGLFGDVSYSKSGIALGSNTEVDLTFKRSATELYTATVTYPDDLTSYAANGTTTSSSATWATAVSALSISFIVDCGNQSFSTSSSDTGSATVSISGVAAGTSCTATLTRAKSFDAPAGLKGGNAYGQRVNISGAYTLN